MQTPGIWHIPQQRNPFFTGREDVLAQLHDALKVDATVALSHPQRISGLGGIGKTQTALAYAYRYQNDYTAVFWIRVDSIAALTSSMIELAHVLELPERDKRDQGIIIQAVLRWLRLHSGWLLIYDNADDLSLAASFLPKLAQGISQELDGLPFALDQAGAYIKEASCTLSEYLAFYQTQRDTLLRERGSIEGYPASIATT